MKHLAIIFTVAMLLLSSTIQIAIAISYSNITVIEANALIESNPSLVILDVRTQSEYDSGHIRLAIHIPVDELSGRLDELNTTDEILVYCKAGGRSASASQILIDNGFLYIFNMLGGIDEWKAQGYPVYIKYSSIQEAINNANEGDTVYVSAGTYYENVVVNKTVSLIGENMHSTIIDGSAIGTVIQVISSNVTISRFTIDNGGAAWPGSSIWLSGSNHSIISNNMIRFNSWYGIGLNYSNSVIIDENIVTNNDRGIWIVYSNNCTVKTNSASENLRGIWLQNSKYCLVTRNIANNNTYDGIVLYKCDENAIFENILSNNNVGVKLEAEGNGDHIIDNIVSRNTIDNNSIGIWLGAAQNNHIYTNNFFNNTQQVYEYDYNINIFDNGCEGNYWSNYAGNDSNGDGIGDTPYIIDGSNQDNFPMMNPYWNPADINHDLEVDIFDVVSACVAYSSTPLDLNWNCHCDIAEPYGVIDIFDIVMICSSYGEEYTP